MCEARRGPCESLSSGESLLLPSTRRRVVVGDDGAAGIGSVTRWMAIKARDARVEGRGGRGRVRGRGSGPWTDGTMATGRRVR